jgi:pilus assembly protein CpaF
MATLHANSARSAISKLQLLPLLAGENIAQSFITPTIASSIDIVIQCSLDSQGKRRVVEVVAVTGRSEAGIVEIDSIYRWNGIEYEKGLADYSTIKNKHRLIK